MPELIKLQIEASEFCKVFKSIFLRERLLEEVIKILTVHHWIKNLKSFKISDLQHENNNTNHHICKSFKHQPHKMVKLTQTILWDWRLKS